MNIDAKIPNKILINWTPNHIKKVMHHDELVVILEIQG